MKQLTRILLIAMLLVLALTWMPGTVAACPTCKDAMAGDPANSNMVNGYFWSILFMMSMPFLVFSGVAAYFYYEVRRARARQSIGVNAARTETSPANPSEPEIALQS